jgi:hypothetical protein
MYYLIAKYESDTIRIYDTSVYNSDKSQFIYFIKSDKPFSYINKKINDILIELKYSINSIDATNILVHVDKNKNINETDIKRILGKIIQPKIEFITYKQFQKEYGKKYVKYKYNRDVDKDHVESLIKYITDTFWDDSFILPNITVARGTDNTYYILDGGHRSEAISKLDPESPIVENGILSIVTKDTIMSEEQILSMFQAINKNNPLSRVYIDRINMEKLRNDVINILENSYYMKCIAYDEKYIQMPKSSLHYSMIKNFISIRNIDKFLNAGWIKLITPQEIANILIKFNKKFYNYINYIDKDFFRKELDFTDRSKVGIRELVKSINEGKLPLVRQLYKEIREIRDLFSRYKSPTKKVPFLLGLVYMCDLYNSIENIDNFDIDNYIYKEE